MMRSISAAACTAALAAFGLFAANPGVALAADAMMAPGMKMAAMATVNGVISGGKGVNLDCGGTTAEVHDASTGKVVASVPTTPAGGGSCAFSARVPAGIALSSCAGKVALGAANEMGGMHTMFAATQRSVVNGHERIGMAGGAHVFSTVANIGAINGDGKSTATITVGTEQ
jgi:hypothetical protein